MHPIDEFGGPAALLTLITVAGVALGAAWRRSQFVRRLRRTFDDPAALAELYRAAARRGLN